MCKCLLPPHKTSLSTLKNCYKKGVTDILLIFSDKSLGTFSKDTVFPMGRTKTGVGFFPSNKAFLSLHSIDRY